MNHHAGVGAGARDRDRSFTTTWPLAGSRALRGDSHQFARTFRARAIRCGGRVDGLRGESGLLSRARRIHLAHVMRRGRLG